MLSFSASMGTTGSTICAYARRTPILTASEIPAPRFVHKDSNLNYEYAYILLLKIGYDCDHPIIFHHHDV